MTRYVLMREHSAIPKEIYKTAAQFARMNGKNARQVQYQIKKHGFYIHNAKCYLWPVEVVEEAKS